jgi:hypothetical protein
MKVLIIKSCRQCCNCQSDLNYTRYTCRLTNKTIGWDDDVDRRIENEEFTFPEWCPLADCQPIQKQEATL